MAGRGEGLQPLRHPPAVPPAEVRAYWFETNALVPHRGAVRPGGRLPVAGRHDRHRRAAVRVRRGRHRHRGAAVPDRIPHDPRGGSRGRGAVLPAGLSEPGGAGPDGPWRTLRASSPKGCGCASCSPPTTSGSRSCSAFFSAIPHDWHRRNELARYEGYYASVFYSHFAAAGLDVAVEDASTRAGGHGGSLQPPRVPSGVQDGRVGAGGGGDGAAQGAATRTSTALAASRSTSSRWSSAARPATLPHSRWSAGDGRRSDLAAVARLGPHPSGAGLREGTDDTHRQLWLPTRSGKRPGRRGWPT